MFSHIKVIYTPLMTALCCLEYTAEYVTLQYEVILDLHLDCVFSVLPQSLKIIKYSGYLLSYNLYS